MGIYNSFARRRKKGSRSKNDVCQNSYFILLRDPFYDAARMNYKLQQIMPVHVFNKIQL